ncbi:MAG: type IV toxin-antitoxin system AbiEi family antitoxin [Acidimicrobiia bacterium]|nr:type IV toxin-antitoxin system AbiEi family antitoxin [Acidimicrobiia bacterium]
MRTLVEVRPPYGVADLAKTVDADPGYTSKLLSALGDELLISRVPRGPVEHVEWESLLRQLTTSYSLLDSNETTKWLASAGPEQYLRDLAASKSRDWAVTGSFAASELVSVAAPEIAIVYADDPERLATLTRLRPVRNGGNVVIARPYDRIVFDRTWTANDITHVSPAQLAVDCLTGPGRMPAEGEALLDWLRKRAPRWQAPSLTRSADLP